MPVTHARHCHSTSVSTAGRTITLYIDSSRTIFKSPTAALQLKLGWNRWETIELMPLNSAGAFCALNPSLRSCELTLPSDLYSLEFVILDSRTGVTDNNNMQDYHLPLVDALTEEQVLMKRITEYEAAEQARVDQIDAEEAKIWEAVLEESRQAKLSAIEAWKVARRVALQAEAEAMVNAALLAAIPANALVRKEVCIL